METTITTRCRQIGFSQEEFSELLRAQIPTLTANRLKKIGTGRLRARPEERELICRILNCKSFELGI